MDCFDRPLRQTRIILARVLESWHPFFYRWTRKYGNDFGSAHGDVSTQFSQSVRETNGERTIAKGTWLSIEQRMNATPRNIVPMPAAIKPNIDSSILARSNAPKDARIGETPNTTRKKHALGSERTGDAPTKERTNGTHGIAKRCASTIATGSDNGARRIRFFTSKTRDIAMRCVVPEREMQSAITAKQNGLNSSESLAGSALIVSGVLREKLPLEIITCP